MPHSGRRTQSYGNRNLIACYTVVIILPIIMLDFSNVKFSHESKSNVKMMLSLMFFSLHPLLWKLFAHKNATFLGNTTELCMKTIFIIPIMMLDFSNIEVSQESESAVKMMLALIYFSPYLYHGSCVNMKTQHFWVMLLPLVHENNFHNTNHYVRLF